MRSDFTVYRDAKTAGAFSAFLLLTPQGNNYDAMALEDWVSKEMSMNLLWLDMYLHRRPFQMGNSQMEIICWRKICVPWKFGRSPTQFPVKNRCNVEKHCAFALYENRFGNLTQNTVNITYLNDIM